MIEAGAVTPVMDRTYPLSEAAEAIDHVAGGHARGKVTISMALPSTDLTSPAVAPGATTRDEPAPEPRLTAPTPVAT
jgi:hypothetical protein